MTRSFPMLGSGETKISKDFSLQYIEGERGQANMNMTGVDVQIEDTTRLFAQSEYTTRSTAQKGGSTYILCLEDEKEVTRPDGREERKSRHSASKKAGGDKGLRIKRVRDPGLGSGIGIGTAAEDGLVLENTVLRKIKKKRGKHLNNRVFQEDKYNTLAGSFN